MTTTIYGIKNCDTMKKVFKWLDTHGVTYTFHDYKKNGTDETVLKTAIQEHGWETVINRRGTTWRKLPEDIKSTMNDNTAIDIARENPSLIKRPLLTHNRTITLGFKDVLYKEIFK